MQAISGDGKTKSLDNSAQTRLLRCCYLQLVNVSCVMCWCLASYSSPFNRAKRINVHNANILFMHRAGIDNVNACLTLAKLALSKAAAVSDASWG